MERDLFGLLVARLCLDLVNGSAKLGIYGAYNCSYWSEFGLGELLTALTSNLCVQWTGDSVVSKVT